VGASGRERPASIGPIPAVFRRTGDGWTIAFQGEAVRLPDSQGLHYLAALLDHPWERVAVHALHATVQSFATKRRPKPASAERARLAVTKAIKTALAKIALVHPALARHLGATVRRGHCCSYTPDPRHPVVWER
jgi:non-specific serine/threonine protein kinase